MCRHTGPKVEVSGKGSVTVDLEPAEDVEPADEPVDGCGGRKEGEGGGQEDWQRKKRRSQTMRIRGMGGKRHSDRRGEGQYH